MNDSQQLDPTLSKDYGEMFHRKFAEKELLLNEIQVLKEKVNHSSIASPNSGDSSAQGQVGFLLRDSERDYWNKLLDSNMRAGTMACVWCMKAQLVKKQSLAFHRWRLVTAFMNMERKHKQQLGARVDGVDKDADDADMDSGADGSREGTSSNGALAAAISLINKYRGGGGAGTGGGGGGAVKLSLQSTSSDGVGDSSRVLFPWQQRRIMGQQGIDMREPSVQLQQQTPPPTLPRSTSSSAEEQPEQAHYANQSFEAEDYLQRALLNQDADVEMKRQILLALSYNIMAKGNGDGEGAVAGTPVSAADTSSNDSRAADTGTSTPPTSTSAHSGLNASRHRTSLGLLRSGSREGLGPNNGSGSGSGSSTPASAARHRRRNSRGASTTSTTGTGAGTGVGTGFGTGVGGAGNGVLVPSLDLHLAGRPREHSREEHEEVVNGRNRPGFMDEEEEDGVLLLLDSGGNEQLSRIPDRTLHDAGSSRSKSRSTSKRHTAGGSNSHSMDWSESTGLRNLMFRKGSSAGGDYVKQLLSPNSSGSSSNNNSSNSRLQQQQRGRSSGTGNSLTRRRATSAPPVAECRSRQQLSTAAAKPIHNSKKSGDTLSNRKSYNVDYDTSRRSINDMVSRSTAAPPQAKKATGKPLPGYLMPTSSYRKKVIPSPPKPTGGVTDLSRRSRSNPRGGPAVPSAPASALNSTHSHIHPGSSKMNNHSRMNKLGGAHSVPDGFPVGSQISDSGSRVTTPRGTTYKRMSFVEFAQRRHQQQIQFGAENAHQHGTDLEGQIGGRSNGIVDAKKAVQDDIAAYTEPQPQQNIPLEHQDANAFAGSAIGGGAGGSGDTGDNDDFGDHMGISLSLPLPPPLPQKHNQGSEEGEQQRGEKEQKDEFATAAGDTLPAGRVAEYELQDENKIRDGNSRVAADSNSNSSSEAVAVADTILFDDEDGDAVDMILAAAPGTASRVDTRRDGFHPDVKHKQQQQQSAVIDPTTAVTAATTTPGTSSSSNGSGSGRRSGHPYIAGEGDTLRYQTGLAAAAAGTTTATANSNRTASTRTSQTHPLNRSRTSTTPTTTAVTSNTNNSGSRKAGGARTAPKSKSMDKAQMRLLFGEMPQESRPSNWHSSLRK